MGLFTGRYYDLVKDYLHADLHDFIHYYRQGNIFDLPLYHGCNKKNRNGTRKPIEYNQGHQCIVPTNKLYWRKTKDKYKKIGSRNTKTVYWTRYTTWTNRRDLSKNKGNFVYNYKLKKFEHMSKTPMHYDYDFLQQMRANALK